ncbi:DUF3604 domain-containing protein [Halioxenophilus sp. WMMB6]|uniref:DUF3604 domain-containing protein n=1 Tax=Halioxenophilus sp. WMMB6 TaxID=3073815 RepID=UPI00295F17B5|nr:DUF3604 domain-containing protein [Halioxenophilus sp. WMMB6]
MLIPRPTLPFLSAASANAGRTRREPVAAFTVARTALAVLAVTSMNWVPATWAQAAADATAQYSPPLRAPVEKNLYWGDLHLHTNLSTDAYINGVKSVSQAEAYRFARGETITADNGVEARLRHPLDFLAVTDHGENLGLYARIEAGDPLVVGKPVGDRYSEVLALAPEVGLRNAFMQVMRKHGPMPNLSPDVQKTIWQDVTKTADEYNQPGLFTAIIGYEWTSMINGDNLHRVVLFRDDAKLASQMLPINANENPDPEALWAGLAKYEQAVGGKVLAIAHNGNLSNGRMFSPQRVNGDALDRQYAETRARWEPVYEVTQVKGDGEAHPRLSPTDEFADFETWDKTNVAFSTPKEPWMVRYEYARAALLDGLVYETSLGVNPFKFGLIGSTDIHTGLSTTEEDNYFGKFKESNPSPERMYAKMGGQFQANRDLGAAGLTAVWAEENTRAALFDALRRREVYGTTGTRIRLRFFGGWEFAKADVDRADYARWGYQHGVPMGGDLPVADASGAPTFLIHAAHDPDSAYLDRLQVIKGWVDSEGESHEQIYNVAMSDGRKPNRKGGVAPVGNTVEIEKAEYSNSIGAPELATWWQDPDFNASEPAFYYVRVLQIPTPRWTTYDAAFYGLPVSEGVPATIQERAYSSPIWYRP